ncbi:hypothetical protein NEFER03_0359 [Nematocida sp. LUAm3]|nr:hypothetical protein NEFER03_0359 [Nematocida sp. LUAm3]KAI5176025.1 hypothetical protein NEFER02_1871 [Nematocida sp. LUAm2]KAI5179122.1 hypothetical protein NEFER01_1989 [Nematocida sp. LUAm1]
MHISKVTKVTLFGILGVLVFLSTYYGFRESKSMLINRIVERIRKFTSKTPSKRLQLYEVSEEGKEAYHTAINSFIMVSNPQNKERVLTRDMIKIEFAGTENKTPFYILDFTSLEDDASVIILLPDSNESKEAMSIQEDSFNQVFSKLLEIRGKKLIVSTSEEGFKKDISLSNLDSILCKVKVDEYVYISTIDDLEYIMNPNDYIKTTDRSNDIKKKKPIFHISKNIPTNILNYLLENSFKKDSKFNITKIYVLVSSISNNNTKDATRRLCSLYGLDWVDNFTYISIYTKPKLQK